MQDQGITITRPWSPEMYEHNARVMTQRRRAVRLAMEAALHAGDEEEVRYIARAICAVQHGQGYTVPQIVSDALITLDAMAGHWMYQDCWPALLERGIVQPTQLEFVGYRQA
jgi:hypothetical protein